MWNDNTKNTIEFSYRTYSDEGVPLTNITRRVVGDDTEWLPNILMEFMYFLHGMTFTYVDNVACMAGDTIVADSNDVLGMSDDDEED